MKKDLIFVLYGSTGDLSFRKLLPAIINLKNNNMLPEKFLVFAIGRRDFSTEEYLNFIKEQNQDLDINLLKDLVIYHKMQITDEEDFVNLNSVLKDYSIRTTRTIHYLSVAPELMIDVANYISSSNLVVKKEHQNSIIFEKPFGFNYTSSSQINKMLWELFDEEQIYRIDHYLGKTPINNIYELRFSNLIFKSILNDKNIKSIDITAKEEVGILNRGSFYDATGAVKDMFQSHLLQVVAMLLMNEPKKKTSKNIIDNKVNVLKKIKYKKETLIFGQYKDYLKESNVDDNSLTETLLSISLYIKGKFSNVPIRVITGKKMSEKKTDIIITLLDNSVVKLNVFPKPSIEYTTKINNNIVEFNYNINDSLDEYAKLIDAAINSKKEMFLRWDEIEESWKIVDSILANKNELVIYSKELK